MPAATRRRRYPSDTTVAEWALLEPLLPVPACQTKTGRHPEKWPRRDIVDGIRYIVDNGAKWRALPADSPHGRRSTGFSGGGTGPVWSPTSVTSSAAGSVPARGAAPPRDADRRLRHLVEEATGCSGLIPNKRIAPEQPSSQPRAGEDVSGFTEDVVKGHVR
ncbi:hypothetical protein CGZ69_00995 [Streptomyces peucetius subsp. caesius ATCC 27952]|nr:hypothetical protein CGZ69_00995 [Streptomyces peucetius subsp. caesius ATCC 27952]